MCHSLCLEFSSPDLYFLSTGPHLICLLLSGPSLSTQSKLTPPMISRTSFFFFITYIPLAEPLTYYPSPSLSSMKSGNVSSLFPVTFQAFSLVHSRSSINTCCMNGSICLCNSALSIHVTESVSITIKQAETVTQRGEMTCIIAC